MASSAIGIGTDTAEEDMPFQFFDLARELRDHVYDHLSVASRDLDPTLCICDHVTLEHGPSLALLQVNKQFKQEYTESIKRKAVIELAPCACVSDYPGVRVPEHVWGRYTTRISLLLFLECRWNCKHGIIKRHGLDSATRHYRGCIRDVSAQGEDIKDYQIVVDDYSCASSKSLEPKLDKIVKTLKLPALSGVAVRGWPTDPGGQWTQQDGWPWEPAPVDLAVGQTGSAQ
ncbi:hypothetical protein Slin15195_G077730 [Septoria linicola]|uniref:Uncharacterized protein n=1 Tax=Septoria linicola TaxID=215465 RepID=A0A9Q9AS71_9PEZI|nr:hypothetical protein Slin14017_G038910 [Septoria linicola]USW54454.1 hypothetical protein Slin15195_G077730 [Septoria linicola]